MKGMRIVAAIAAMFLLVVGVIVFNFFSEKTTVLDTDAVKAKYIYDNIYIDKELLADESKIIKSILNDKRLYKDSPSCGFSEDISIQLNSAERIFSIARDSCPIFKDEKTGKYFQVTQEEYEQIYSIFKKYGAIFPCI